MTVASLQDLTHQQLQACNVRCKAGPRLSFGDPKGKVSLQLQNGKLLAM